MVKLQQSDILSLLAGMSLPAYEGSGLVVSQMVEQVIIDDNGAVTLLLKVDRKQGATLEDFRQDVERHLLADPRIASATVILTAERKSDEAGQPDPHGMSKNPRLKLPVKHIIAVASGKGGVGKSTVAVNLAVAMAAQGLKVGLLDADIYGPSVPHLLGLQGQKPELNERKQLIPLQAYGISVMSIGFMVDVETPMIWRGPMVQTAIYQLLRDVDWSGVDILIVDMPPGTGDAQLTMAQKVPMSGAVIISTPQDLALIDARKGIEMFKKTSVPILGLIENMSAYICENCGHETHIFAHGGAEKEAEKQGVPFLGAIPLTMDLRKASDSGSPLASSVFKDIAKKIISVISSAA